MRIEIVLRAISVIGFAFVSVLSSASAGNPVVQEPFARLARRTPRLITDVSAGSVRIGFTVAQARRALRPLILRRTSDGEGVALIAAMSGTDTILTLYAGEGDPSRRINERARIEAIEVWDRGYATPAGVHPGMSLQDVEKRYGKLTSIVMSEIESRESAYFDGLPQGVTLRVASDQATVGRYQKGLKTATEYNRPARVMSISINGTANRAAQDSLCSAEERVVFNAAVEGSDKIVSICSSNQLDDRQGYLQYRFGRPGRVELQFPSNKRNSQKAFTYTRYTRPLVTYLTLTFKMTDYQYAIHDDHNAEQHPTSKATYITVTPLSGAPSGSKDVTIKLGSPVRGSLMSLEDVVPNQPWSR